MSSLCFLAELRWIERILVKRHETRSWDLNVPCSYWPQVSQMLIPQGEELLTCLWQILFSFYWTVLYVMCVFYFPHLPERSCNVHTGLLFHIRFYLPPCRQVGLLLIILFIICWLVSSIRCLFYKLAKKKEIMAVKISQSPSWCFQMSDISKTFNAPS